MLVLSLAGGSEHSGEPPPSLPPVRPPDLSVTVWVRKKRWKDRLERRSRLASSVAGKSEAQGGSLAC